MLTTGNSGTTGTTTWGLQLAASINLVVPTSYDHTQIPILSGVQIQPHGHQNWPLKVLSGLQGASQSP